MKKLVIAIDGTSGSGKSSVCGKLAKKLGINHFSSGLLYRAIAFYVCENNIDEQIFLDENNKKIPKILEKTDIEIKFIDHEGQIYMHNECITDKLSSNKISLTSSIVSQNKFVREFIKKIEQDMAMKNDIIIDGRDMASVLKNCTHKFFITASIDERAKRRYLQHNKTIPLEKIKEDLVLRDYRDEHRKLSPLKMADDAIRIDSTNINLDETVEKIYNIIKENENLVEKCNKI